MAGQGRVFQVEGTAHTKTWRFVLVQCSSVKEGWNVSGRIQGQPEIVRSPCPVAHLPLWWDLVPFARD